MGSRCRSGKAHLTLLLPYLVAAWLLGVVLLSLRLLLQWLYAERFKRKHTTIAKNPDTFARDLATVPDKELRRQLLEQAFTYSVISASEYQSLLKTVSRNDAGLEQAANQALEKLESNRVYEQPYLVNSPEPLIIEVTPDDLGRTVTDETSPSQ
jgi:hypothetical protein